MLAFVNTFENSYNWSMTDSEEARTELAATAGAEVFARLLHDPSFRVIRALLGNSNLREEDVLILANRKNLPVDVLRVDRQGQPLVKKLSHPPRTCKKPENSAVHIACHRALPPPFRHHGAVPQHAYPACLQAQGRVHSH